MEVKFEPDVVKYLDIKQRIKSLKTSIRNTRTREKFQSIYKELSDECETLNNLEKLKPVVEYKILRQRQVNLTKSIAIKKKYNIESSELQEELDQINNDMLIMTGKSTNNTRTKKTKKSTKKATSDPQSYYMISLAWTIYNPNIISTVSSFLFRSSYLKYEKNDNMMIWKFGYDTDEEKSMVKSLQICAAHLLDVIKGAMGETDAEIFGKPIDYI